MSMTDTKGPGGPDETAALPAGSPESRFPTEDLPRNREPLDPLFGPFFQLLRGAVTAGGSELGLGLTLFSLTISIRAVTVVEIGRFKGFSTLCLAGALRFLDAGWQEPAQHKQRPDIDYAALEARVPRRVLSIDPNPMPQAVELLRQADLLPYVDLIDCRSDEVLLEGQTDLLFIDGDHSYEGCRADVERFVPTLLRPGGYFILHDYFGWYDAAGRNLSPVKRVIDELGAAGRYTPLLIDTGYMSFAVFRKPDPALGI